MTWKDCWKGPKKFNKFMLSFLYLYKEMVKFGPIFEENESVVDRKQGARRDKQRVPCKYNRSVGCNAAKSDAAFEAIMDKVSKKITAKWKTSSVKDLHQKSCIHHDLYQSITDGMKELKEAMMEIAQQ